MATASYPKGGQKAAAPFPDSTVGQQLESAFYDQQLQLAQDVTKETYNVYRKAVLPDNREGDLGSFPQSRFRSRSP